MSAGERSVLLAVRLADSAVRPPLVDVSRLCVRCGSRTAIMEAGQNALAEAAEAGRTMDVVCLRCITAQDVAQPWEPAPGALDEWRRFRPGQRKP